VLSLLLAKPVVLVKLSALKVLAGRLAAVAVVVVVVAVM
jgi:hypothetical protein